MHLKERRIKSKPRKFKLVAVAPFDARRGYRRWKSPGVGVQLADISSADADFWIDKSGSVFVRLTSQGYVYHCQAMQIDGKQLSVRDRNEFNEFITGVLHDWMIQGVDDSPEGLEDL